MAFFRTLTHHAFMISSSWFLFQKELVKIKHNLENNFYPLSFIENKLSYF